MHVIKRNRPMDLFTRGVLTEKYELICRKYRNRNLFKDLEHFLSAFRGKRASPYEAGAIDHKVALIDPDGDFEPGNVRLVDIECESDLASIYGVAV